MKVILMTGTPGTGKTTTCKRIKRELKKIEKTVKILNVSELIKKEELFEAYDADMETHIIDDAHVRRRVKNIINSCRKDYLLIETHTVSTIPRNAIDRAIVLTAETSVLYDRLTERNYPKCKIEENIDCEIMQVVYEEAVQRFGLEKTICFQSPLENEAFLQILETLKD